MQFDPEKVMSTAANRRIKGTLLSRKGGKWKSSINGGCLMGLMGKSSIHGELALIGMFHYQMLFVEVCGQFSN